MGPGPQARGLGLHAPARSAIYLARCRAPAGKPGRSDVVQYPPPAEEPSGTGAGLERSLTKQVFANICKCTNHTCLENADNGRLACASEQKAAIGDTR